MCAVNILYGTCALQVSIIIIIIIIIIGGSSTCTYNTRWLLEHVAPDENALQGFVGPHHGLGQRTQTLGLDTVVCHHQAGQKAGQLV
jgi:hypothetical protein